MFIVKEKCIEFEPFYETTFNVFLYSKEDKAKEKVSELFKEYLSNDKWKICEDGELYLEDNCGGVVEIILCEQDTED